MRLADYVVSYSLQINNRCLRYLAECDSRDGATLGPEGGDDLPSEGHMVYAESLLTRDSRRLASMWSLMKPGWAQTGADVASHVKTLKKAASGLADGSSAHRLAMRLASVASEDHEAQAILTVARKLRAEKAFSWDVLNELFAKDSYFWRESVEFRHLPDDELAQRIARSYKKCYRLADRCFADTARLFPQCSRKLQRRVQLCAHQLELLRPGLSDKGKSQLWYLLKMSDTLRTRSGLQKLHREAQRAAAADKALSQQTLEIVLHHIDRQIEKMDKRMIRLASDCFSVKPKRLAGWVNEAVDNLGLRDVSLMQAAAQGGAGRALSGAAGPTTGADPTTGKDYV
ncbi:MAG: hypothetical protein ACFHXK_19795 [bacterium]